MKGLKIAFTNPVVQKIIPKNQNFSNSEINNLKAEISKLQASGAVIKCVAVPDQFLSKIFLANKSDGSFRFILNLKNLNSFISTQHFKMEDIRTVTKLITKNCYMATIDLKDAYFLIKVNKTSKKYLRFMFEGEIFEFQCLPFGLSLAPFIFTKLMKPVVATLRNKGLILAIYLDDIICFGNNYEDCLRCVTNTKTLLENLGFVINFGKSKLQPKQFQTFLGFELHSQDYCLKLPIEKRVKVQKCIENISKQKQISIRDFAKFLGILCSVCPAVSYGWVYTKLFEREKFLALRNAGNNYDTIMMVPISLTPDFVWWMDNIMRTKNLIRNGRYALEIFSDASLTGWGAFCNGERISGFWNDTEINYHINVLELKAAFNGLKCFAKQIYNKEILLRIDNTTAISYINRYGGVQFLNLNESAREIWQWCEKRQLHVFASYIKSKDNVEADEESRRSNIDTEWSLSLLAFKKVVHTFGRPEIDLFATRTNAKCDRYFSWKRDPEAFNIDAFTADWGPLFFYSFPPFSLILRCLRKIINDKATGIMIVPHWPSQPWYPLFLKLSQCDLIYFEPDPNLLLSPFRTSHPLWTRLTLVSSLLSGKHMQDKT